MQKYLSVFAAALAALVLAGCDGSVNAPVVIEDGTQDARATQTVNGAIRVGNDVTVTSGSFRSVNGAATIGSRSTIPSVSTVNGAIRVGEDSTTGELSTVNGSVTIGARTRVNEGIGTVNGGVTLGDGAVVDGGVTAVNGRITLNAATVTGGLENHNGGIRLVGASVVEGGITVKRPRGMNMEERVPEVWIGSGARVVGPLVFEREVRLRIHREAQVGEIQGATPEYFDDDGETAGDDEDGDDR